jgi:hypothetical protein
MHVVSTNALLVLSLSSEMELPEEWRCEWKVSELREAGGWGAGEFSGLVLWPGAVFPGPRV